MWIEKQDNNGEYYLIGEKNDKKQKKQREKHRKYVISDRLDRKTVSNIQDLTPYFAVYNMKINKIKEEAKYLQKKADRRKVKI